ncbi:hypothetical protein HZS_4177 [Henneguya salminicola]|nr:hypothetical protein HZS_4177 [Henneguya salminicola]
MNETIYADSNNRDSNKYIRKARSDSEYISSNVHIYQDLSNALLTTNTDNADMNGYDHINDYADISDLNINNYFYSKNSFNTEESAKFFTHYSYANKINLSSFCADDECYEECNK